jgi:hypothetical protein
VYHGDASPPTSIDPAGVAGVPKVEGGTTGDEIPRVIGGCASGVPSALVVFLAGLHRLLSRCQRKREQPHGAASTFSHSMTGDTWTGTRPGGYPVGGAGRVSRGVWGVPTADFQSPLGSPLRGNFRAFSSLSGTHPLRRISAKNKATPGILRVASYGGGGVWESNPPSTG